MHIARKIVAASAAAIAVAGLSVATPAASAEKVNYLLPAPGFLPAFAPWQLAKYKGFYAEEGLEVTFQTVKGGVDVAKQVGVGNAPIGGAIGDTSILVRPNGIPVRSVALMGGGSLVQVAARADRGIEKVEDLKGKTITVLAYQDTTYYASLGVLASRGLTKNDANIQAAGPQGVWKLLVEGKSDAMMGVPDWIGIVRAQGVKLNIFNAKDYFPSMAQAIVASDDMIKSNPKLIQGLVRASLKGLKMIMDDPDAAAELQVLTAQFIDGFVQAADKMAYLRLAGVPLEKPGTDGGPSMKLVDVKLTTEWQVGSAAPSFGSQELSYLPFPGEMIDGRTNMDLVYVSLKEKHLHDIRHFLAARHSRQGPDK